MAVTVRRVFQTSTLAPKDVTIVQNIEPQAVTDTSVFGATAVASGILFGIVGFFLMREITRARIGIAVARKVY